MKKLTVFAVFVITFLINMSAAIAQPVPTNLTALMRRTTYAGASSTSTWYPIVAAVDNQTQISGVSIEDTSGQDMLLGVANKESAAGTEIPVLIIPRHVGMQFYPLKIYANRRISLKGFDSAATTGQNAATFFRQVP